MRSYNDYVENFQIGSVAICVPLVKVGQQINDIFFNEEVLKKMVNANQNPCLKYDKDKKELVWSGLVYGYMGK